jgi:hypothetical protein
MCPDISKYHYDIIQWRYWYHYDIDYDIPNIIHFQISLRYPKWWFFSRKSILLWVIIIPSIPGSIIPYSNQLTRVFLMSHISWCVFRLLVWGPDIGTGCRSCQRGGGRCNRTVLGVFASDWKGTSTRNLKNHGKNMNKIEISPNWVDDSWNLPMMILDVLDWRETSPEISRSVGEAGFPETQFGSE